MYYCCVQGLTDSADDYPGTVNVLLSIVLYNNSYSLEMESGLELGRQYANWLEMV